MADTTTKQGEQTPCVIVTNGFNKFHMSALAAELAKTGNLAKFVTGAYPNPKFNELLTKLYGGKSSSLQRLSQRVENIPRPLVSSLWSEELVFHFSRMVRRYPQLRDYGIRLNAKMFEAFGRKAIEAVKTTPQANIYHYRAGYGSQSVQVAKDAGKITLCDHSIVHPSALVYLLDNGGALPDEKLPPPTNPIEIVINGDIDAADHVVVNSDFVKATMLSQGFKDEDVSVIYLGVDDQFLDAVPKRQPSVDGKARLMFAGGFIPRKGAPEMCAALNELQDLDWTLTVAASIPSDTGPETLRFLESDRVTKLGFLTRAQLSEAMSKADIFVFPTLAEGSARVVFEALACGCYVITTPNSGSVVENGVHGAIVQPSDKNGLKEAIKYAILNPEKVRQIGESNKRFVADNYTQAEYGKEFLKLYTKLLSRKAASAQRRAGERV